MPGILTMISAPNTSTETVGFLNQASNIADSRIKKLQGRYINPTMLLDQPEGNSHVRLWHKADLEAGADMSASGEKADMTNLCLPISIYEYTA